MFKSQYKAYVLEKSVERINAILGASGDYKEQNSIPREEELTYANGFYVYCSALFIDIRDSSTLTQQHYRPKLAKLYRAFVSEVVAVMNDNTDCKYIRIVGDCVSGVFNTPLKSDIDDVFSTAARLSSLVDILNFRFARHDIEPISVGIGMDYGRALMVKAGDKGSGVNEVIWMGDVLNTASNLCGYGSKMGNYRVMVSNTFYENLNDDHKRLLHQNLNVRPSCYHGSIINIPMDTWLQEQQKALKGPTEFPISWH